MSDPLWIEAVAKGIEALPPGPWACIERPVTDWSVYSYLVTEAPLVPETCRVIAQLYYAGHRHRGDRPCRGHEALAAIPDDVPRLVATCRMLAGMLQEVARSDLNHISGPACPVCCGSVHGEGVGHAADCRLKAVLDAYKRGEVMP